jgi:hypothetical protein
VAGLTKLSNEKSSMLIILRDRLAAAQRHTLRKVEHSIA